MNEAWSKITYHILTLPFDTYQRDGGHNIEGITITKFKSNIRVEAFRCYGNDQYVGLPPEYKSPLISDANYHYYTADKIDRSVSPEKIYGYNNTTYYLYTIKGTDDNVDNPTKYTAVGTEMTGDVDIYVTYDYNPTDPDATLHMDLSATMGDMRTSNGMLSSSKEYNIRLKDRMLVLNQNRQNRPGAVKDGFYTGKDLASDDFCWIEAGGLNKTGGYRHFKFKFGGNDPYNVTLYSAYNKPTTLRTKEKGNGNVLDNANNADYDKYIGSGKNVYKEYRGASFFAKMNDGLVGNNMWLSSEANLQWTDLWTGGDRRDYAQIKIVPGYFKGPSDHAWNVSISNYYELSPIFNSFAILNHESGNGYVLAGSKINVGTNNWQPKSDGTIHGKIQYLDYDTDGHNVKLTYFEPAKAASASFSEVKEYKFRVVTPFNSNIDAVAEWSDYNKGDGITTDMVPSELKRKYVAFTGFYADAAHTNAVATYAEAQTKCATDGDGRPIIYVGYQTTSDIPFTALAPSGSYTSAKWYELTDKDSSGKKIKWDSTNSVFKNNGAQGSYAKESEFAFMGDPYDLRIINRALSESASGNIYIGSSSAPSSSTALSSGNTRDASGFMWEIPSDDTEGSMVLKQKGTTEGYWQWNSSTEGNTIMYNTTSTRVKVMEVGKLNYTFKIIDLAGNIAIKATAEGEPFSSLSGYANIPESIRSPFLADEENISFWRNYINDGTGRKNLSTGVSNLSNPLTEYPETTSDIYVTYTTTQLTSKNINLTRSQQFNVKLNGHFIYWDATTGTILSKKNPSAEEIESAAYLWHLRGRDPYSMRIDNLGATLNKWDPIGTETADFYNPDGSGDKTASETIYKGMYVQVHDGTWSDGAALDFVESRNDASRFVAMMGNHTGVYEVLAATGNSTYYHIGRETGDGTEAKIYASTTYDHGADELRFELAMDQTVTYTLVDKAKNELLTVTSKNPRLALPADYVSPLVEEYYYYETLAKATTDLEEDRITEISADDDQHVYVTYKVNDRISYGIGSKMYRLKFDDGDTFHQEDGHDHMNATKEKAVYPYINGDCNFNIYSETQYDEQMGGAASTRTRWAWYVESANSDPYHVKIVSRQLEPDAQKINQRMYFRTYVVNYDDANHVVTGTTTPGVTEVQGTEYMVLGLANHYKLVTTNTIDDGTNDERRTVTSFEQYWKTWEIITNGVDDYETIDGVKYNNHIDADGTVHVSLAFNDDISTEERSTVEANLHKYTAWAKSRPATKQQQSKRFANETHYYNTVNMGTGTFDFVEMEITPVMVLLDQHGWEIMRKPLPTSTTDPEKEAKYNAIRPYNSPMVKEYRFWSKPTKARGHHYYKLATPITKSATSDEPYTSTDLTKLPPIDAKNVKDSYGDLNDQYVTYITKDEYLVDDMTFLVQQGEYIAKTTDGTNITTQSIVTGLSDLILNGSVTDEMKWNLSSKNEGDPEVKKHPIETEMGIAADPYPDDFTKGLISLNTFDPYSVQIESVSNPGNYFTSDATDALLDEGSTVSATNAGTGVTLTDGAEQFEATTYDNAILHVTNSTFMVVQDENGNMQIMPRFDQNRRITGLNSMSNATQAPAGDKTGSQTTFLVRPHIHEYIIVDKKGDESLRYKQAGEDYPSIPSQYQSPLATDFRFYKTISAGSGSDYDITTLSDEIAGALSTAELTYTSNTAEVYVHYNYDQSADADRDNLLQGPWVTMTLGGADKWVEYSGTLNTDGGIYTDTKPDSGTLGTAYEWHWKFLESPFSSSSLLHKDPDPYRVELFNRNANGGSEDDMSTPISIREYMSTPIREYNRFALLNHSDNDGGYALAAAGRKDYTYQFLNGYGMTAPSTTAASVATEASFGTNGTISGNAKITVANDIPHTYTYKVITNNNKLAVQETQSDSEAQSNGYVPRLPETIQSQLLNEEDYVYYGTATESEGVYTIVETSQLDKLYGIYDDSNIYVRYTYDKNTSPYRVPNERNTPVTSEIEVGSGSNFSPLDISGELGYNIFWKTNDMMYNNNGSVDNKANQELSGNNADEWKFVGGDPYALQIKSKAGDYYIDGDATLSSTPDVTFMLLKKDGYDYGILAKTGYASTMLSGYGEQTVTSPTDPNKYIIFALATHNLIYNLKNPISGESTYTLTYRTVKDGSTSTLDIPVTTIRNDRGSNIYVVNAGKVSLGDNLETPVSMSRPYCSYTYYIDKITDADTPGSEIAGLSGYKGLKCEELPDEVGFINKDVYVNVVYDYNTSDVFESQKDYVANPEFRFNETNDASTTQWYTLDSRSATPALMNYKMTGGDIVRAANGRDLHYTNDYLWTAEGDPYGMYIHNRYAAKNANKWGYVVTTADDPAANATLIMSGTKTYAVYEMTTTSTDGYFRLHPINKSGLYVYNNAGTPTLSTSPTDWKFTLNETQLRPYKDRAGYVGGLNDAGKTAYDAASTLTDKQTVVYTNSNIKTYEKGYYRLSNMPGAASISSARYLSGYRNKIELEYDDDDNPGTDAVSIPIHFYGVKGVINKVFDDLGADDTNYTRIPGVWGDVPVPAPEYDASSIFYFPAASSPSRMLTQGLEIVENKMTATTNGGTQFTIEDLGGAVVALHNNASIGSRNYLNYNQSSKMYDAKYGTGVELTDYSKWCMEPATNQKLLVETNSDGTANAHYYATFCAPFDVMLTDANDVAYIVPSDKWPTITPPETTAVFHPKKIGTVNTGTYAGNDQFIPAGTPVIIRSTKSSVTLTLPTTTPTAAISTSLSGRYLTQKVEAADPVKDVYVLGLPMTGTFTPEADYAESGNISAITPEKGTKDIGFYKNANPNREASSERGAWKRNNLYVNANRAYYRKDDGEVKSQSLNGNIEFIPVLFDDQGVKDMDLQPDGTMRLRINDGRAYDIQGRCVATEQEVSDGSWLNNVAPGMYIVNGKKFVIE